MQTQHDVRIDFLELSHQPEIIVSGGCVVGVLLQTVADVPVRGRAFEHSTQQSAQIQSGSTHEQWRRLTGDNPRADISRSRHIFSHAEVFVCVDQVQQVMRNLSL